MGEPLSGLALRQKVAGILGYKVCPCTQIMAARDYEGFELIMPDGRPWGPWRPTEEMVWNADCSRYESDPSNLLEMWKWIGERMLVVEMCVYPGSGAVALARKVGNFGESVASANGDKNPVTAVARLVCEIAAWERQNGKEGKTE